MTNTTMARNRGGVFIGFGAIAVRKHGRKSNQSAFNNKASI
ncbi:MAG: hypothetical protein ACRC8A_12585 [Microcoleaceae cyanobacterium]